MSIRPLSFRRRLISDRTLRLAQPMPWASGMQLSPLIAYSQTGNALDATSATANVPGAWTQIFVSTDTASTDVISAVMMGVAVTNANTSTNNSVLIDVATGASGSEVIVAQDIAVMTTFSANTILLPVRIQGGTRISYRCRPATAGRNVRVQGRVTLFSSPFGERVPTSLDTYGTSQSTSSGTACSGSSGTWTQVTASTSRDYQALVLIPSGPSNGTAVTGNSLVKLDLGVGSSGSEVVVASINMSVSATSGSLTVYQHNAIAGIVGRLVPAGSRLAIRHNMSANPEALCACVVGVPYV